MSFPLTEFHALMAHEAGEAVRSECHASLVLWLAGAAGYASGAKRLGRRSNVDLREALNFLSVPFFKRCPAMAAAGLNSREFPRLDAELQQAELERRQLHAIVKAILEDKKNAG